MVAWRAPGVLGIGAALQPALPCAEAAAATTVGPLPYRRAWLPVLGRVRRAARESELRQRHRARPRARPRGYVSQRAPAPHEFRITNPTNQVAAAAAAAAAARELSADPGCCCRARCPCHCNLTHGSSDRSPSHASRAAWLLPLGSAAFHTPYASFLSS